jgi:hypothetical protein
MRGFQNGQFQSRSEMARRISIAIAWRILQTPAKFQAPTSRLQRKSNDQASNAAVNLDLKLGASLELGAWNLELQKNSPAGRGNLALLRRGSTRELFP